MASRSLSRRLNMDEMAVDELSFYEDEIAMAQRSFTASPQLMGLLSPEGSPQRFQIVEQTNSAHKAQHKFLQPRSNNRRPQKLNTQQNANSSSSSTVQSSNTPNSKSFRLFHSLSSGSMESSMDDEYMELFEMESLDQPSGPMGLKFPSNLNSLISGHIKSSQSPANAMQTASPTVKTPEMRRPSVRRCLSMTDNQQRVATPQTPEFFKQQQLESSAAGTPSSSFAGFKRPEPPSLSCSPVQSKRLRQQEKENVEQTQSAPAQQTSSRQPFRRYVSMNDAEILSALARSDNKDEPDLIGDFSKPFALPLMEGRHRDLKSISSDTVAGLLRGQFKDTVASYKIIDCRYPYEYEGGHIRGAINLYTQEQILEEFLKQKTEHTDANGKRNIIIFHCEFSSERGPKLSRFLRNNDRERNTNQYPSLDYPEIYLLHNGYKEFFETHADLCDPIAYRPMLEPSFSEAYRHFRAKSKSWNGDGLGGATSRLKKSRSRLML